MFKILVNRKHFVLLSLTRMDFFDECLSCEVTTNDSLQLGKYFACLFGFRRDTFITFPQAKDNLMLVPF